MSFKKLKRAISSTFRRKSKTKKTRNINNQKSPKTLSNKSIQVKKSPRNKKTENNNEKFLKELKSRTIETSTPIAEKKTFPFKTSHSSGSLNIEESKTPRLVEEAISRTLQKHSSDSTLSFQSSSEETQKRKLKNPYDSLASTKNRKRRGTNFIPMPITSSFEKSASCLETNNNYQEMLSVNQNANVSNQNNTNNSNLEKKTQPVSKYNSDTSLSSSGEKKRKKKKNNYQALPSITSFNENSSPICNKKSYARGRMIRRLKQRNNQTAPFLSNSQDKPTQRGIIQKSQYQSIPLEFLKNNFSASALERKRKKN